MEALRLMLERGSLSGAGDELDGRGFYLRDAETGEPIRWLDPRLARAGAHVVRVAGTSYRPDELRDPGFEPGKALALVREPENLHDPNAIAVWSEDRAAQAGYVPAPVAAELAGVEELCGLALWEWRSVGGDRIGLRALVYA
ncbi:MAG: HIRAN domain-containing protein, partial [Actinomycetota bacterium]|nr:HIRAN domain-containing protein [Actinomycetota bacterium]